MNYDLLEKMLARTSPNFKRAIRDFARSPTERNECYMSGYVCGLKDAGQISNELYGYMLSLIPKIPLPVVQEEVLNRIRGEL